MVTNLRPSDSDWLEEGSSPLLCIDECTDNWLRELGVISVHS